MNNSIKRTREEISALISEWQQSNLSKKNFCDQKKINYQTFIGWIVQRRSKSAASENKFIPVQVDQPQKGLFAEIYLSDSRKIVLHQLVDLEFIKAILKC